MIETRPTLEEPVPPIEPITLDAIPPEVIQDLINWIDLPEAADFEKPFRVSYADGTQVYGVEWLEPGGEEPAYIYLSEWKEGERIGRANLGLNEGKLPHVGYTETLPAYQRAGLAERRYKLMNKLSVQKYGVPIIVDNSLDEAVGFWDRLAEKGIVEKNVNPVKEGTYIYTFKTPTV